MTVFECLKSGEQKLLQAGVENASFEAKELLLYCFNLRREEYPLKKNEPCEETRLEFFTKLCDEKISGRPLQYILGKWDFFGYEFNVREGCLIPRPESEIIVDTALSLNLGKIRFADMCCGSGCIGISYAAVSKDASGIMLDISDAALEIAKENTDLLIKEKGRLKTVRFDVFSDDLPDNIGLLMSNPPYVNGADMKNLAKELSFEPQLALYGGEDGLDFYRAIAERHIPKLAEKAYIILEIGYDQSESVSDMLKQSNCNVIDIIKDSAGICRTVLARKK